MLKEAPADETTSEFKERFMHVGEALPAYT